MAPFFSVIIPIYNTGKELERCVNSVLSQTFEDMELILVDDGSTDDSGQLCDQFAEKDERVLVIHQENGGSSEARNTGVRNAKGNYLVFLDSDDMWSEEDALEGVYKVIKKILNTDVVVFGLEIWKEDGTFVKTRKVDTLNSTSKEDIIKNLIYTNQYFSASYVKILRRTFFIENNLFFKKGLLSGEDMEWSARVMVLCDSIQVYPSTFYKRIRRNEGSITSDIGKKNILDVLDAIEKGISFIQENESAKSLQDIYYEYWAYNYAMLLGLAVKVKKDPEYSMIYKRLADLKWLLKYDHVKKVKMMKLATKFLGLKGAMKLLSVYYARNE